MLWNELIGERQKSRLTYKKNALILYFPINMIHSLFFFVHYPKISRLFCHIPSVSIFAIKGSKFQSIQNKRKSRTYALRSNVRSGETRQRSSFQGKPHNSNFEKNCTSWTNISISAECWCICMHLCCANKVHTAHAILNGNALLRLDNIAKLDFNIDGILAGF